MRLIILLLLLIIAPVVALPQTTSAVQHFFQDKNYSFQLSWQDGKVFGTNAFLRGQNAAGVPINHYQALSIRLVRQTTGTNLWEQLYRYPRCGVGLYVADFNSRELGMPIAAFGFMMGPIFRLNRFSLDYDFGIGLSFNWNTYDPEKNPYNISISSKVNSFAEAGINLEIRLIPRLNAGVEFGTNHFSNGATILPNKGVNGCFLKYNLRYNLYSGDPPKINNQTRKFEPANEWLLAWFTGFNKSGAPLNTTPLVKQSTVPVFATGIFAIYHRQISYKSKVGAGIEFGYMGLINPRYISTANGLQLDRTPDLRRLDFSIFPSYELVINRFSLFVEAGFYLYRNNLIRNSPFFYQRVGFKYFFTKRYFAAIQVRAYNLMAAQLIEWTLGYRF